MSRTLGAQAEALAADYLRDSGLTLVEHNVRCPWGEIDLVMREKEYWVFVEVKARTSQNYGGGFGAITPRKQSRVRRTAEWFLAGLRQSEAWCRFDAVEVRLPEAEITWLRDAF